MTEKTALVTGMSKGIGAATAIKLLNDGYYVHGTFNTDEAGASRVRDVAPDKCELHQCDFSDRKNTLALCEKFSNTKFSAVVNNAGIVDFQDFSKFDFVEWDRVLEVNLTAQLVICQKLSGNIENGGAIVNIASTDGMTGTFASISYAASKAGVITMTKGLGNVLGQKGIRVNAIAPGWVDTDMSTEASYAAGANTPLGRNGRPEEIADAVLYLLSSSATFVNGTTLIVDGGYTNVDVIMMREAEGEL